MPTITIVNQTDGTIATATADARTIWSGRNGHLPKAYYHHTCSTPSNVQARWFQRGVSPEFPRSEAQRVGFIVAGVFITFLGAVGTVLSVGAIAPVVAEGTWTFWSAFEVIVSVTGTAGGIALSIAPEVIAHKKALESVSQTDRIKPGGVVVFKGKSPFRLSRRRDGQPELIFDPELLDSNGQLRHELKQPHGELMAFSEFDALRRDGKIFQIRDKDHQYHDLTQAFINLNLQMPTNVIKNGAAIDTSRIYRLALKSTGTSKKRFLKAGRDENDNQVYVVNSDDNDIDSGHSNSYWQFIPASVVNAEPQRNGWIIVDRRYMRSLCFKDDKVRQYHSEEPGITLQVDERGVPIQGHPEHARVPRKYMNIVWCITESGHIFLPYQGHYLSAKEESEHVHCKDQGAKGSEQEWELIPFDGAA